MKTDRKQGPFPGVLEMGERRGKLGEKRTVGPAEFSAVVGVNRRKKTKRNKQQDRYFTGHH